MGKGNCTLSRPLNVQLQVLLYISVATRVLIGYSLQLIMAITQPADNSVIC